MLSAEIRDLFAPNAITPLSEEPFQLVFPGLTQVAAAPFMIELNVALAEGQELIRIENPLGNGWGSVNSFGYILYVLLIGLRTGRFCRHHRQTLPLALSMLELIVLFNSVQEIHMVVPDVDRVGLVLHVRTVVHVVVVLEAVSEALRDGNGYVPWLKVKVTGFPV